MNTKVLSQHQIEELFRFCEAKGVKYFDVQIEIVDHLANAIEALMIQNKDLTFDMSLKQVYQGFGVTGFRKLIIEKEAIAASSANKLFFKLLISYFKLPQLLLTASILSLLAIFYKAYSANVLLVTNTMSIITLLLWIGSVLIFISFYRFKKRFNKPLLLLGFLPGNVIISIAQLILVEYSINWLLGWEHRLITNVYQFSFIGLIVVITLLVHLALLSTIKKIKQQALTQYGFNFK